ncbi:hypothetical protein [Oceanotoga phage vB_OteS-UFV02]
MRKFKSGASITNNAGIGIIDIEFGGINDYVVYAYTGIKKLQGTYEAEIDYDYEKEGDEELTPFFIDVRGDKWFLSEFIRTDI